MFEVRAAFDDDVVFYTDKTKAECNAWIVSQMDDTKDNGKASYKPLPAAMQIVRVAIWKLM